MKGLKVLIVILIIFELIFILPDIAHQIIFIIGFLYLLIKFLRG